MDAPCPGVVVTVHPPLLAEALGRVLHRKHGQAVTVTSPGHGTVEMIALNGNSDRGGYVLRLPDRPGEPALLLAPDGRSTTLFLADLNEVVDLVGEALRRG